MRRKCVYFFVSHYSSTRSRDIAAWEPQNHFSLKTQYTGISNEVYDTQRFNMLEYNEIDSLAQSTLNYTLSSSFGSDWRAQAQQKSITALRPTKRTSTNINAITANFSQVFTNQNIRLQIKAKHTSAHGKRFKRRGDGLTERTVSWKEGHIRGGRVFQTPQGGQLKFP